jgi:hypothetical protein
VHIKIYEGNTGLAETKETALEVFRVFSEDVKAGNDYWICQNFANRLLIAVGSNSRITEDIKVSDFIHRFEQ